MRSEEEIKNTRDAIYKAAVEAGQTRQGYASGRLIVGSVVFLLDWVLQQPNEPTDLFHACKLLESFPDWNSVKGK